MGVRAERRDNAYLNSILSSTGRPRKSYLMINTYFSSHYALFLQLKNFFNICFLRERERNTHTEIGMSWGGTERDRDTESETGSRL